MYAEASVRAGGLRNKYESSDLRDATGRSAEYDSSSAYYGLHLGAGYVWNITDKASLDMLKDFDPAEANALEKDLLSKWKKLVLQKQ